MRREVHFKDSMFIKDLTRRRLWCQWRHIITHRNQGFDKAPSVVSITSYYYTQKSMIICLHHACCFIIYIIVVKIKGENPQIIDKFSNLAKYDINIASYQSRNRFSFLCLDRVVIIWIISKILWKINNKHVEINQYNLKPVYNRHSREPENVPWKVSVLSDWPTKIC